MLIWVQKLKFKAGSGIYTPGRTIFHRLGAVLIRNSIADPLPTPWLPSQVVY